MIKSYSLESSEQDKLDVVFLRTLARELQAKNALDPRAEAIRSVTVISNDRSARGFDAVDFATVIPAFEFCALRGIPVSPDFVLHTIGNPIKDFLGQANPPQSDLLIMSYVPKKDSAQSWGDAAQKSGATIICTFGGDSEVGMEQFIRTASPSERYIQDQLGYIGRSRPDLGVKSSVVIDRNLRERLSEPMPLTPLGGKKPLLGQPTA